VPFKNTATGPNRYFSGDHTYVIIKHPKSKKKQLQQVEENEEFFGNRMHFVLLFFVQCIL
jgi:hypothetical protein